MKRMIIFYIVCFLCLLVSACNEESVDKASGEMEDQDQSIITQETEDDTYVSDEAEIVLMQIAKDLAEQIAQNPGTVKFKDLYWGFAREETTYAVQGTFECSNLLGVTEEHDIQVWCEASEDYSKIQPYAVYLDGEQIT